MVFKAKVKMGAAIVALLVAAVAAADDSDPMAACDNSFATCNSRCDALENATAECYGACDDAYQKCLDTANGYAPAAEPKSSAPKPASTTTAKKPQKSIPASESQDEGADPDGSGHQQ